MTRALLSVILLTLVYALTVASFDPLDVLVGAAISVAIVLALRPLLFQQPSASGMIVLRRIAALPLLVLAILRDIVVGTWNVAVVVLGIRELPRPGIVEIPLEGRSQLGMIVSAYIGTLSPGEYLVDIDEDRGRMLVHVLDASDPDAVRAKFADFYARFQRQVVP